jgi:hypothetical protein
VYPPQQQYAQPQYPAPQYPQPQPQYAQPQYPAPQYPQPQPQYAQPQPHYPEPQQFPQQQYATQTQSPVPTWPDQTLPDPLAGLAAPYAAPAYVPQQPYTPESAYPTVPAYAPQPAYLAPITQPQAPAAGSRARTGAAATADTQADLWFLSNQPTAAIDEADADQQETPSSSLLTVGLTVAFAILVIFLVLAFFSLMTNILG